MGFLSSTDNRGNVVPHIGRILFVALLVALGVGVLFGSCTVVPPGHRGVSVTLGKVYPMVCGEGLNFKKPFIEQIVKIPIQQITAIGKTSCFSSDLQLVEIGYSVLYRLPQEKVVELYQQYQGDPYQALVVPRMNDALKQVVSGYSAEEIVKSRDKIKPLVLEKIQKELAGLINIVDIPISNVDLSDQLEAAIEAKQVQQQQALAKTYELQKAQKEAEITVVNAKAEAEAVRIKGEALKASPEVISLEISKKWNGIAPTTVVVGTGGANVLLPLK